MKKFDLFPFPTGNPDSDKVVTTAKDLGNIISSVRPVIKHRPLYDDQNVPSSSKFGDGMDECYPGLYIGDLGAAQHKGFLKRVGITHVLNAAQGSRFSSVNTNAEFYKDVGIKFLGIQLEDLPTADAGKHFEVGSVFIDEALKSGGRALVHCYMGVSRSATLACAFLMLRRDMSAQEALRRLRENRLICPNDGFLAQLAELDNKLRSKRGRVAGQL